MEIPVRITSDAGGGLTATCPQLPGCVCRGTSPEQVLRALEQAVDGYLAAMHNAAPGNLALRIDGPEHERPGGGADPSPEGGQPR